MNTMQGKTRKRRSAIGTPWRATLIMACAALFVTSCAPSESDETGETAKSALDELPQGVTVLQAGVSRRHMCYCAYLLVDPMTESELRQLGHILIQEAKPLTLKGFLYYDRESFALGRRAASESLGIALFLNAVDPDYELRINGEIPEAKTKTSCWRAWMHGVYSPCKMVSWGKYQSIGNKQSLAWSRYNEGEGCLEFQEKSLALFQDTPVCMPAIISTMIREHLSCSRGQLYWHRIPSLREVTIHFVGPEDERLITFTYPRSVYERAVLLPDKRWKQRAFVDIPEIRSKAEDEHQAMVITKQEMEARKKLASSMLWELYKEVWVALAPQIRIEKHREIPVDIPEGYYVW